MNTSSSHYPRDVTCGGVSRKRQKIEYSEPADSAASSNQLLAGYLAHEFLTRGTLFGERWNVARAGGSSVSGSDAELKKLNLSLSDQAEPMVDKREMYAEVANILKTDGAHLVGIVNPTQLATLLPR